MPPYAATTRALNTRPSEPPLPPAELQPLELPRSVDLPRPQAQRKSHERSPPINRTMNAVAANAVVDNAESFRTDLPKTYNLDEFMAHLSVSEDVPPKL